MYVIRSVGLIRAIRRHDLTNKITRTSKKAKTMTKTYREHPQKVI